MIESSSSNPEPESTEIKKNKPKFSPRYKVANLLKYGASGAISFASSWALEGVALAGGSAFAAFNPFVNQDPRLVGAALALSYIPLVHSTLLNAEQSWRSLNETGISVSWNAKLFYETSKKVTTNRTFQKTATYLGFSIIELAKEIPWWIGAFVGKGALVQADQYSSSMELAFLTGANLAGSVYQYMQAEGVDILLRNKRRIVNFVKNH